MPKIKLVRLEKSEDGMTETILREETCSLERLPKKSIAYHLQAQLESKKSGETIRFKVEE